MRRALVTGGCGFLGSWIARQLVDDGVSVRVLALPGETRTNLESTEVEIAEGNVLSVPDVESAVAGVDTVFHAAAVYADWAPDPTRMYDVNMRGTFNVLEAARRAGVERVVYTASIVSLGRPDPGETADEKTPYEAWDLDFAYSRSKYFSREIAEYFASWGQDVRVVCPGIVVGPGDVRPTPSGRLIVGSFMPGPAVYFDGGASYVDVRDAARVHVLAAEKGRPGERYVASAHNLDNRELVEAIDRVTGRRRPYIRIRHGIATRIAKTLERRAERRGEPPLFGSAFLIYGQRYSFYDATKARTELGAEFRPFDETLSDAIAWFRARGMIRSG
jgi:dihydroflavonol-4-reductase